MVDLDTMMEIAEAVDGDLRTDYSGKGMYGERCVGIVTDDPRGCVEMAATFGIFGANQDSMGKQYIVYWPHVKADEAP